jgi:hypothetical protein
MFVLVLSLRFTCRFNSRTITWAAILAIPSFS